MAEQDSKTRKANTGKISVIIGGIIGAIIGAGIGAIIGGCGWDLYGIFGAIAGTFPGAIHAIWKQMRNEGHISIPRFIGEAFGSLVFAVIGIFCSNFVGLLIAIILICLNVSVSDFVMCVAYIAMAAIGAIGAVCVYLNDCRRGKGFHTFGPFTWAGIGFIFGIIFGGIIGGIIGGKYVLIPTFIGGIFGPFVGAGIGILTRIRGSQQTSVQQTEPSPEQLPEQTLEE